MRIAVGLAALLVGPFVTAATAVAAEGELFKRLDSNGDGVISADEVSKDQKRLFDRLLRTADKNNDGKLSREEFAAGTKSTRPKREILDEAPDPGYMKKVDAKQIFARMDKNQDGKLEKDELPGRIRQFFDRLDGDGSGALDKQEVARLADRLSGKRPGAAMAGRIFDRLDANKDGKLTADEVPEPRREGFKKMLSRLGGDAVTKEQFAKVLAMRGRRGKRRPEPGRIFDRLDANQDGKLTADEVPEERREGFKKLLSRLGVDAVNKEQFVKVLSKMAERRKGKKPQGKPGDGRRPSAEQFLKRVMQADKDGDGKLSKDEAPERMKQRFDRIDADGDGFVDTDEIKKLFSRIQGKRKK